MTRSWFAVATLSVALIAACGGDRAKSNATGANEPAGIREDAKTVAAHTMSPEDLGTLGAEIQKEPAKVDELLARHGLDQKSFEQQIRQVTENPDAAKRYAEAYRRARA